MKDGDIFLLKLEAILARKQAEETVKGEILRLYQKAWLDGYYAGILKGYEWCQYEKDKELLEFQIDKILDEKGFE